LKFGFDFRFRIPGGVVIWLGGRGRDFSHGRHVEGTEMSCVLELGSHESRCFGFDGIETLLVLVDLIVRLPKGLEAVLRTKYRRREV
jgi:hypothetical protein